MSDLMLILALILVFLLIILSIGLYQKNTNAVCMSKTRLDGKMALITGGTAGMGLEVAKDFAQRGARVIVVCPFEDEGRQAVQTIKECSENQNVVFKHLDLASMKSIRKLAADILKSEDRLDILVNNAGVGYTNIKTSDGLNFVLQVNYFGAFLLAILLLPILKKTGHPGDPSRIINVSSAAHVLGRTYSNQLGFDYFYIQMYANSKLYMVQFSRELSKRLKDCSVVINNVDPGAAGTRIFQTFSPSFGWLITFIFRILFKTPWQGAQTTIHVALDKQAGEVSGEYFKNCKLGRAVSRAYDDKLATELWEESVKLVKLTNKEMDECFRSL